MSEQFGKFLTCDRCGRTFCCEEIGNHVYKDPDEGWIVVHLTGGQIKHLCPPCNNDFVEIVDKFFKLKPKSEDLPGWAK